jgi:hypothetical protein
MMRVATSLKGLSSILLVAAAAGSFTVVRAGAEPLDEDACANLQTERKQLLDKDMQSALDQGPNWVKSHLTEPDIERVRHFLNIEEQIEFRCRGGGVTKAKASPTGKMPLPDRKPAVPAATVTNLAKRWRIRIRRRPEKPGLRDDHCSHLVSSEASRHVPSYPGAFFDAYQKRFSGE